MSLSARCAHLIRDGTTRVAIVQNALAAGAINASHQVLLIHWRAKVIKFIQEMGENVSFYNHLATSLRNAIEKVQLPSGDDLVAFRRSLAVTIFAVLLTVTVLGLIETVAAVRDAFLSKSAEAQTWQDLFETTAQTINRAIGQLQQIMDQVEAGTPAPDISNICRTVNNVVTNFFDGLKAAVDQAKVARKQFDGQPYVGCGLGVFFGCAAFHVDDAKLTGVALIGTATGYVLYWNWTRHQYDSVLKTYRDLENQMRRLARTFHAQTLEVFLADVSNNIQQLQGAEEEVEVDIAADEDQDQE